MGRIFWQFFLAIWLTLLGAIAFITISNSYLKVLPPKGGIRHGQERLALDIVSELIYKGDLATAKSYIAVVATLRHPTFVTLTDLGVRAPTDCRGSGETDMVARDEITGRCYRISVTGEPLTFLETYAPTFLPPLAALLTSIIMAGLLARYLVRPVVTIRRGLNALAHGDFSMRIGGQLGRWRDEITALGQDFDVTATKLQELRESQERLLHDVSHELRSPLSRLQAALGLLRQNPNKLDSLQPRMDREIKRLDELVGEILTLARLGSPESRMLERQALDIIDLLNAIVDDAAFEAEPRGITVTFHSPEHFVSAVNGELIYRAVENVMRNAVKYADPGTAISVEARLSADDALDVTISNRGAHVPPEDVERIFEPFARASEGDLPMGHGLGLAITRRALALHGASVRAQSRPEGGLVVDIRLPRSG